MFKENSGRYIPTTPEKKGCIMMISEKHIPVSGSTCSKFLECPIWFSGIQERSICCSVWHDIHPRVTSTKKQPPNLPGWLTAKTLHVQGNTRIAHIREGDKSRMAVHATHPGFCILRGVESRPRDKRCWTSIFVAPFRKKAGQHIVPFYITCVF